MGYEVFEDNEGVQKDKVGSESTEFPALFISVKSGETIEKFRVDALKRMIIQVAMLRPKDTYAVYMEVGGTQKHIGYLRFSSLRSIIDSIVFKIFDFKLVVKAGVEYVGDMIYTQCANNL